MKTDLVANEERELLTRRHPAFGFTACVLAAVSFLVATPNPSTASTAPSTLCHGYAGCSTGSFTTHGYPSHSGSSYWRMYAGNNCTNYVAYVESTAFGVATPANLLGDADQWPANATLDGALVNHTPTVGSVAEWNPGSPGIPYPGHVAVVERVGPHNRYIVISQQNILDANDYDWVRINADSSLNQWQQWPSNFIHFPAGEPATGQGSSPRVVEIVVRVAPSGPPGEKFEFLGRREHIVTAWPHHRPHGDEWVRCLRHRSAWRNPGAPLRTSRQRQGTTYTSGAPRRTRWILNSEDSSHGGGKTQDA